MASSDSEQRHATLSLIFSAVLFAAMALVARVTTLHIPGPQVALVRFVVGILAVLTVVALGRTRIRPRRWGWLFTRGFFGGLAVFAYFSCIEHAGVGVATLLNYTSPVWSVLFAWWLLGERPRRGAVIGLSLTVVGVAMVLGAKVASISAGFWEGVGIFSAIASAMAVTSIRAVRRRSPDGEVGENSWTVFASFTGLGALATLPSVVPPIGHWVSPSPAQWVLLLGVAVLSIVAQLLMTRALQHVTASGMGIIHQLVVVIAMIFGVLFFGEHVTPLSLAGSVITVGGVAATVLTGAL